MHHRHSRTILIEKAKLIEKIKQNRAKHIEEFETAKLAYAKEAAKQLTDLQGRLAQGATDLKLDLVTPINRSDEYDKVIEMFDWEIETQIQLSQDEFNDYVHDDNESSRRASLLNSTYLR